MWVSDLGKESGVSPYNEQISVWLINGNIKDTCDGLNATCYLNDYCGPNSSSGSGSNANSASAPASASAAGSLSSLISSSGFNSPSNARSVSAPSSSFAPSVVSMQASEGNLASSLESVWASGAASLSALSPSSALRVSSAGFSYENITSTEVTTHPMSTTVITVTSCSEHKCFETPVTTGVTTIYEASTAYTTYCPLSGKPVLPTAVSEVPSYLSHFSSWLTGEHSADMTGASSTGTTSTSGATSAQMTTGSVTSVATSTSVSTTASGGGKTSLSVQSALPSSVSTSSTASLETFTGNNGINVMVSKGCVLAAAALVLL
ncbi:LAME_0D11408g1_1 [Lachancea meyersii CBS 8951]|uniref:LAME_0D11408g1_1 n=1 Tax=Lachancea meyersii CBS 8951 TaxID=1266667 RepID=A0A1G4JD03_9SACH|nr:LAME_0D11408g1_1 [Lachancea meyersii CBS 8951]